MPSHHRTGEDTHPGQTMGEMLLAVMGRIGELSIQIPKRKSETIIHERDSRGRVHGVTVSPLKEKSKLEKLNITEGKLKQAQFIKNHPDLVKETIAEGHCDH